MGRCTRSRRLAGRTLASARARRRSGAAGCARGSCRRSLESMLDCSLAKCANGNGEKQQRVVFQALGDTTRFYCADKATGNPITTPARCKGFVNAKKLCSACRCNAQGRAPELVFERLNGNSICYCKGEEGKTISEVCAGPLPSAGKAVRVPAPRPAWRGPAETTCWPRCSAILGTHGSKSTCRWRADRQCSAYGRRSPPSSRARRRSRKCSPSSRACPTRSRRTRILPI